MVQENLCRNENIKKFDGFRTKNTSTVYNGLELYDEKQKKKLYTCIDMYQKKILNNFFEALKIDSTIV